jgi:phospholipase/carboxylesterase
VDFSTGKPVYNFRDVERGFAEIVTCIEEIHVNYDIAYDSVFLMGFSQGAIMSYYTLYHAPEKIGGIIALSGRILSELSSESSIQSEKYIQKRVFIGHGTEDQMIPVSASDTAQRFIQSLGIVPSLQLYSAPHTITPQEMRDIVNWFG